ncbi:MAG: hypothetical protein ABEJ88_02230 [Halobacterium sp.]
MDARGQSETIGMVLLLAITVAGIGVVVAVGGSALDAAEHSASVQRAEQSMTLLDARAALVALGRTDGQVVPLAGSGDGSYRVRPESGRITVLREYENGTQIGDAIVNATLGSVVYENGETVVAYQGGGVWRSTGAGARMVSPPEFNYQDATLTLPIIRVTGGRTAVAGTPRARVTPNRVRVSRFPNENRSNPLSGGIVVVRVQSEYYRGWASFFEDRTEGNVTVYPGNETVELELVARKSIADFTLRETPLELRGLAEDDPISAFTFTLKPNKASSFNDLDWSLVADEGGSQRFKFHVDGQNPCKGKESTVTVTYTDGDATYTWQNTSAFTADGSTYWYSCDGDTPTLYLDLMGPTNLTYTGTPTNPLSNNSTGYIVNHYLAKLGPSVTLEIQTKTGNRAPGNSESVDLQASTGYLDYAASGARVVTFLHVTENSVNVTLT